MSAQHELLLSVIDRLLLGALLAAVGLWIDRRFDLLRTGRSVVSAMLDRRPSLKQAFSATQRDRALDLVHKQLSLLYWPLYMRLQQQEAARKLARPGAVPGQTDTVALIEKQAYLIEDQHLLAGLLQYVKHVAVHRAASADSGASQDHAAGEPYPEELLGLVERKLVALQAEEQRLLNTKALGALL